MRTLSDNIYLICHEEKPTEHKTMKKFRKQDSEKYFEEKKPVRLVDTQEYMEMIRALLEDGQEVSMIVTGNSMRPFLKHGRDKICMKKIDRKLRKGDIVFYRRENGQYVMHRILKCGDQSYTLLGDGQIVPESGIRQEQIFARITKVQVRGKWIGSENFRWRFFEHIWIRFCGIRKLGFSFSLKVQNLKKSSKEIHNETVRAAGKWKDGTFQEIFDDWKWILHYSVRYRWTIFFYTFLGMVSTSLGLLSSIAGKYLIDIVTGYQMNKAGMIFGVMAGSFAVSLILNGSISRILEKLNVNISNDIRADLFEQILDVSWLELSKYQNGDMLSRFNQDIETVGSNAVSWLPAVVIAFYHFLATFLVLFYYDKVMAGIALGSAPFVVLMSQFMMKKQRDCQKKVREMSSRMMTFEAETFYNMDMIKSLGISLHCSTCLKKLQEQYKKITLDYNLFSIKTKAVLSVVGMAIQFTAFGYCLFRLWTHAITYGTMTLFLQQRNSLSGAFQNLVSIIPSFLNSSVSAHRLRELTELPKEIHSMQNQKDLFLTKGGLEVRLENVTFSYTKGKQVFRESDFCACPGEIVALVGTSGEGKTTLLRLILGLIEPDTGKAILKAQDKTEQKLNADTRVCFSYVPQGNTLLAGSIAENLSIAKEGASREEMKTALEMACAWEFVKKLPEGLETKLGERGKGLSEGQSQRIAIARALLRNAPVILLDEATSALDEETEKKLLKNILEKAPEKTCIVTTHRPGVLRLCRRVYRVEDGKIAEQKQDFSGQSDCRTVRHRNFSG